MANDEERLVVAIEARIAEFEKRMLQAERRGTQSFNALTKASRTATQNMERDMIRTGARIEQAMAQTSTRIGAFGKAFAAGLVPAVTIEGLTRLIDASTKVSNALKVAGLSGAELTKVYDALFASAQRNGAPIEALVTLYSRASASAKDLNASQADLLNFSDKIALALRVSGQSAEESAGALLQLSQALGNGVVQAEEYNSLLDGGRPILQAVAAGMKEAGGSVSELTKLVKSGKVSSEAFFRAFLAGAPILEQAVAGSTSTISQRLTKLQNALIDAAGRFNESTKAAETFGAEIDRATRFVNNVKFDSLISQIQSIVAAFVQAEAQMNQFFSELGKRSGASGLGKAAVDMLPGDGTVKSYAGGGLTVYSPDAVQDRIDGAFGTTGGSQDGGGLTPDAIRNSITGGPAAPTAGRIGEDAAPKPISLADYKVPAKAGSGGGGKAKKGGKGDDYSREIEQIKERTAALQTETAAQAAVNPLIDDYGEASARASAAADLLSAAQKSGTAAGKELADASALLSGNFDNLSPAARQQAEAMLALAEGYGKATAESQKLADAQDDARQKAEEWNQLGMDVTKGFITDLVQGKSAADAFKDALAKIADTLLDQALSGLFGTGGGKSSGGGLFGQIFSGLFNIGKNANGTDDWRGGPTWVGENGPEIINAPSRSQIVPNHRLHLANSGGGGRTKVDVGVSVDDDGNLQAYVKRMIHTDAPGIAHQVTQGALQNYDRNMQRSGFGQNQHIYSVRKG